MTTVNVSSYSGGVVQATYLGTSQAYPYPAPYGQVDSNSLFNGQVLTENTQWKFISNFTNIIIDHSTAQSQTPPYSSDINDYSTAPEGFEGEDTATIEVKYSDGTTAQFTVTVTVAADAIDVTPDAFIVAALTNQSLDSYVEFAPIEITGVDAGEDIPVTVTGTSVEYAVDAGAGYGGFTSTSTNVQLGYFVKPRIRTSLEGSTEVTGSIDIGGVSSSLSATTSAAVPQSIPVIADVTTTRNSVSATFTYSGGDATGFEARVGTGPWESVTSPVEFTGLSASLTDTLQVRATNDTGEGGADSVEFTTDALDLPAGVITFGSGDVTDTTISQPYSYSGDDQTGFQQRINGGSWVSSTSPIELSDVSPETTVGISVRAVNDDGAGQIYSTTATTDAAPDTTPPTLSLSNRTTLDTTPVITGLCGDATSITLVVVGVGTYTPENISGAFSVQLPEVAVGEYVMTLDAEDSEGNASEQQTATLRVIEQGSGFPVIKGIPSNSVFGSNMLPEGSVCTLLTDDDGSVTMDQLGVLRTSKAQSLVTIDVDGNVHTVFVKPEGSPVKPFYKINWQIMD